MQGAHHPVEERKEKRWHVGSMLPRLCRRIGEHPGGKTNENRAVCKVQLPCQEKKGKEVACGMHAASSSPAYPPHSPACLPLLAVPPVPISLPSYT